MSTKFYEGFGYRCSADEFWPVTKEGIIAALGMAPKTMNKVQAIAAETLRAGEHLGDLDSATEICEVISDQGNCQHGLFWLMQNLISERDGIELTLAQDCSDNDYFILAFPVKDEDGQDIRYGNWPDMRQRLQDIFLRYQGILGIWICNHADCVGWHLEDQTPCREDSRQPWLDSSKREFYVDTPLGKLRVRTKYDTDSPGVWVEYISPYTKEPVSLVCVEYVSNSNVPDSGYLTCDIYNDPEIYGPRESVDFEHLDCEDLEAAKQKIEAFRKESLKCEEVDFSDLSAISVAYTSIENTNEELEVLAVLDLLDYKCVTYIMVAGTNHRIPVRTDYFSSLEKMISELIDYLDFDSLVELDKAEWDVFSGSAAGKEWLTQKYPAGTRIRLEWKYGDAIDPGTEGTVESIDGAGYIQVIWDNGRTLSLAFGVDTFEVVEEAPPAQKEYPPVYRKPWSAATFFGEVKEFRASMDANFKCAEQISQTISRCYADNRLNSNLALDILVPEFGLERIAFVLANTIRAKMHDGRIDRVNKDWAYSINVPGDDKGHDYNPAFLVDNPNPGLVNLLVNALRRRMAAEQKEVQ